MSLLVYAGEMSPDDVTERLGLVPSSVVRKGERTTNRLGRMREGTVNGWFLSSEGVVQSFDCRDHFDWLLGMLLPRAESLRMLQQAADVKMYVQCVWWFARGGAGGPVLWPEQMRGLAELDLELAFAIADYSRDDERGVVK